MLKDDQERYLNTIPDDQIVKVQPFNVDDQKIAASLITEIKKECPELDVQLMGSTALGISGQRDLDVYALAPGSQFDNYLPKLIKIFGRPLHQHSDSVEWKPLRSGREIEFYLTDPESTAMKEQILVFNLLKSDSGLAKEYEALKLKYDGKSRRGYQRAKYEFFNKILTET